MRIVSVGFLAILLSLARCSKGHDASPPLSSRIYASQIVEVSGGKQAAGVGAKLSDPVVVQVNGTDGNALRGAVVKFRGDGLLFNPTEALSDSSGQVSVGVQLGGIPGNYEIVAETPKSGGGMIALTLYESALGYQAKVGKEVADKYCRFCHDPESTPERVSNFDNLAPPGPHQFTDGNTLNKWTDADLIRIITNGGPALGKSPQTPPYRTTLTVNQINAVVAYIRAVADPPYKSASIDH